MTAGRNVVAPTAVAVDVPVEESAPESAPEAVSGSARRFRLLRTALGYWRTRIGLLLAGTVVLIAVLGPLLASNSPTEFVGAPYGPPTDGIPFGTDFLGRDVLSRFLHGGLLLLILASIATIVGVSLGTLLGLLAGYRRGWLDDAIMRTLDVLLVFPAIVLAILMVSILGTSSALIVLAVAVAHLAPNARVMRGAAVQLTGRDFVTYAEALGIGKWRVLFTEILPNVTSTLSVEVGIRMTYSIALVASLGFLGLGSQPPAADWGLMINENRGGITQQPWAVVLPVAVIAVLTVGTNLMADGFGRAGARIDRSADSDS